MFLEAVLQSLTRRESGLTTHSTFLPLEVPVWRRMTTAVAGATSKGVVADRAAARGMNPGQVAEADRARVDTVGRRAATGVTRAGAVASEARADTRIRVASVAVARAGTAVVRTTVAMVAGRAAMADHRAAGTAARATAVRAPAVTAATSRATGAVEARTM